ncbi:MAG: hypothetical protein WCJ66_08845 [Verrucomicrobiota bacterium]
MLLLLASSSASLASGGFPKASHFPEWLSVAVDVPKPSGSQAAIREQCSFRVTFKSDRKSEIQILDLNCSEPHFWVVKKNGTKRELTVKIEDLYCPTLKSGLTIPARGQLDFPVEMKRLLRPTINANAKLVFEIKVAFVMGEIVDRIAADGSIHSEVNGFQYDVILKVPDAERLFSETEVEQRADGKTPKAPKSTN